MLQSWRANCDVSVLVYDHDPCDISSQDIAAICGYVTAYCTKGNASYKSERNAIISSILAMEDDIMNDSNVGTVKLARHIMNSTLKDRIISRSEATCQLLRLPLYKCTESFFPVSLSKYAKLSNKEMKQKSILDDYALRPNHEHDQCLNEFVIRILQKQKNKNAPPFHNKLHKPHNMKQGIPHPTGIGGQPVYPPSINYAKATLIMHKPWSTTSRLSFEDKNPTHTILSEFNDFLTSKNCPITVRMSYDTAKENYFRRQLKQDAVNDADPEHYQIHDDMTDDVKEMMMACKSFHRKITARKLDRGLHYDFQQKHQNYDHELNGTTWLQDTQTAHESESLLNRNNTNSKHNVIDKVNDNPEQSQVVYSVIKTLKRWMEFPDQKRQQPLLQFNPLYLTVQGAGGTGKSTIINIIVQAIETMFPDLYVVSVTAPTGAAAFGVGGTTCHKHFKLRIKDPTKPISTYAEKFLKEQFTRTIALIFDERSLMSLEVLGGCEYNFSANCHKGANEEGFFGNIPIVILLGDDHQLPSVQVRGKGKGAPAVFTPQGTIRSNKIKNAVEMNGAKSFKRLASNVVELKENKRSKTNDSVLRDICCNMRNSDGVTEQQADFLQTLHLDNDNISEKRRSEIKEKAIWIFHTNFDVDEHNFDNLCQLVTPENPVVHCPATYEPTEVNTTGKTYKNHFENDSRKSLNCILVRNARVALTRNIWAEKGLFNGSMGKVIDIRYQHGTSPLKGDKPAYVIVDFDNYLGPPWDKNNPSFVPIPVNVQTCSKRCCTLHHMPLTLSSARTLHKFQGAEVGETYPIKIMVFDMGDSGVEGRNPGFAYTGISRALTLGMGDVNASSLYFTGFFDKHRLTDLVRKRTSGQKKYVKVIERENWQAYLQSRKKISLHTFTTAEKSELQHWCQNTTYTQKQLDDTLLFHSSHNN